MRIFRVIVPVAQIAEAERFYSAVLARDSVRVSPGRAYFDCGGVILACYDARADGDEEEVVRSSEPLYIAVEDVEAVFQRATRAGAKLDVEDVPGVGIPGSVESRPWGERSFYCRDPFGNQLCFVDQSTLFTAS